MKKSISILAAALLAVGCGKDEPPEPEQAAPSAQEQPADSGRQVVRRSERRQPAEPLQPRTSDDPEKRIPRIEGEAQEEGFGLTMVIDGSSPAAFQESLELIAMDTSQEQYRQLDSALRFLGTYDTAAWQGLPNLYKALDGLTGEEIIERAERLRSDRRR